MKNLVSVIAIVVAFVVGVLLPDPLPFDSSDPGYIEIEVPVYITPGLHEGIVERVSESSVDILLDENNIELNGYLIDYGYTSVFATFDESVDPSSLEVGDRIVFQWGIDDRVLFNWYEVDEELSG